MILVLAISYTYNKEGLSSQVRKLAEGSGIRVPETLKVEHLDKLEEDLEDLKRLVSEMDRSGNNVNDNRQREKR